VTHVLHGIPFRAAACTGALFHIELYLVCGDLLDLEAGVYHYGAHDNALRQLRRGDFRRVLFDATGAEPSVVEAPVVVVLTSTWWRNAWKYESRAYRHAFWDGGTILANLLSIASAHSLPTRLVLGFADPSVERLLDINPSQEGAIALVAIGANSAVPVDAPDVPPLHLPTRELSARQIEYPLIAEAHAVSSLPSGEAAARWRSTFPPPLAITPPITVEPVESVILRRGSSRRFTREPVSFDTLTDLLGAATSPFPCDAYLPTDVYVIVNAVDGLAAGSYVLDRDSGTLRLLAEGDFRAQATYLDLGQRLAGDAAVNVYWLVNLDPLDDRAYRAAQLSAAIEGGRLYLGAYGRGLGATGLTFFDNDVATFFSPHAAGKSVMFLTAVGVPARRA
jgi:SagB-type dehydrogenase family enzyme